MKEAEVTIGLINPKSPTNVGAVMRAARCYRVGSVFYTGERYDRAARFATDTQNASQEIPLAGVACLLDCQPENTKMVCVELVEGAMPLPEYHHPNNAFYVFVRIPIGL